MPSRNLLTTLSAGVSFLPHRERNRRFRRRNLTSNILLIATNALEIWHIYAANR